MLYHHHWHNSFVTRDIFVSSQDAESESLLLPVKIGTQFQSSPTRGSERSPQTVLAAHLKVPLVKVVVEERGIGKFYSYSNRCRCHGKLKKYNSNSI